MNGFSKPGAHGVPGFTRTSLLLGLSKHDLERDSGFSDASSEYLSAVEVTDPEDAGRNGSVIGQEPTGQQVAGVGGSYTGLSPMIIMNNFVLKQQDVKALSSSMTPSEKQWGFSSPMEVMPQSQVVLLQPMVSNSSSSSSSSKSGSSHTRRSKSYMPIRKSYPRIAPYPTDSPSKRVGSLRATETSECDQRQRRHHHRLSTSPSPPPALQTQAPTTSSCEAAANKTQAAESQEPLPDKSLTLRADGSSPPSYTDAFRTVTYQDPISVHRDKLKRFSNTYNILSQSGLLGITMRTKQLMKENKRTQSQLHQLREQTALLLDALNSGDPQLWTKLQFSLQNTDSEHLGAKAQGVEA